MILATFKAVLRTKNPKAAEQVAAERGLSFGLCVFDGWLYVSEPAELEKGGCISIQTPVRKGELPTGFLATRACENSGC